MKHAVVLVAVRKEGDSIVLCTATEDEFEATTPQELWDDLLEMFDDPTLPKAEVTAGPGDNGGSMSPDASQIFASACDQIEVACGASYGPLVGKALGHVARTGGPSMYRLLRKVSRGGGS